MGVLLAISAARQEGPPPAGGAGAPSERAFVEVAASKRNPYLGESFELRLRFGFDADLLENHLAPLFARELELPVQVEWGAERGVDGLSFRKEVDAGAELLRFALDDGVATARAAGDTTRAGRTFKTFEWVRRATAARAGALAVPEARLRFAITSRFDDDLVRGRVAVDREVVVVPSAPLALEVRALPEAGRPAEFTGAVGRRTIAASAEPVALVAGESVRLTLTLAGEGDPESFAPPDLSRLSGFVVRGVLDEPSSAARRLVYDLAPVDSTVQEIPALAFAWFSPDDPVGYVTVRTEPIALAVAPRTSSETPRARAPADEVRGEGASLAWRAVAFVAAGILILAALQFAVRRWARRSAVARVEAPRRAGDAPGGSAAATVRARLAESDADAASAFTEYLATRLGVAPAAVVSPDLAGRLERRGVPRDLAACVSERLAARIAARYAGRAAAPTSAERRAAATEFLELVDRLERLALVRSSDV
jgi:hypothetical protein